MCNLFKFTLLFACYVVSLPLLTSAQEFQFNTLANLDGTNGATPNASVTLVENSKMLLGTAYAGGISNKGTIFAISNGILTTLVSFSYTNGENPNSALTLGPDGNYYGTTINGGTNQGGGTIFRISTNGTFNTLFNFYGSTIFNTNGKNPNDSLLLNDGIFYGTARLGGSGSDGTVFKVTTNGTFTLAATFNGTNGAFPATSLTTGPNGLIYGVTSQGIDGTEKGTFFSMETNGTLTKLFTFILGGTNGWTPNALALGSDGNFYGTTFSGGDYGFGTLFKMTTNGTLSTLVSFNVTNGSLPSAALAFGNDGLLYGTTFSGGLYNDGTIFKIATNGSAVTVLHNFDGTNGAAPNAALTLGSDGSLYGTTSQGGAYGFGTVFKLSPAVPQLNIALDSGMAILTWTNTAFGLQSAPNVTGIYTNLPGSMSPYTSSISSDQQFFRLIEN